LNLYQQVIQQRQDLWGNHESDQRGASWIIIDDAEVSLSGKTIEIREGVGIDRHTGTAAEGCKYNRAILPKGVTFPLKITLDLEPGKELKPLWQLLQALEQGDIRIGAAKTRGLGRVELEQVQVYEQDLSQSSGIFQTLLNGGNPHNWDTLKAEVEYKSIAQMTFELNWKPRDPVMVKAEGDGIAVDMFPLVSQVDSGVRFVIPGSSIKGVLRAHAERIVRTVCDRDTGDNFLQQVRIDLVNQLFGAASKSDIEKGFIGAIAIDDCYAKQLMTAEHWSAVENSTKATDDLKTALQTTLDNNHPFRILQPAYHVAIDRWTGGAAEGMLYSVLEPIGVEWEAIGIRLDLERLKKWDKIEKEKDPNYREQLQPVIALLLLVLRDFANCKIPIGYGTNRGMGTVEVTQMTMNSSEVELQGWENRMTNHSIGSNLEHIDSTLLDQLTQAWSNWIDQYQGVTS
jgi:CRISPR/Cas system CSM-associated protein Csm3 (group 7 of RAMP superfamily)